jgi:hypothetical protein
LARRFSLKSSRIACRYKPGQVERIFVPAVEHLDPLYIRRIVLVLIEVQLLGGIRGSESWARA